MPVIKKVEDSKDQASANPAKQEYLNARRRVKGGIKAGGAIVAALLLVLIAVIGFSCSSSSSPKAVPEGKAKLSQSSSSLQGKHYQDVETILKKDGFTNIEFRAEGDLITGFLHDDGDVDTVSIDGDTTFSSGTLFDKDAKVVIAYHSYPAGSSSGNSANAAATTSESFRATVDEYEAFVDEYVAFMQKYTADPSNTAAFAVDYAKMLAKYQKLNKSMQQVDTSKLTEDDYQYYVAALERTNAKLATVGQ